jgi:hypothetical protein
VSVHTVARRKEGAQDSSVTYAIAVETFDDGAAEILARSIRAGRGSVEHYLSNKSFGRLTDLGRQLRGLIAARVARELGLDLETEPVHAAVSRLNNKKMDVAVPTYETLYNVLRKAGDGRIAFYNHCGGGVGKGAHQKRRNDGTGDSPVGFVMSAGVGNGYSIYSVSPGRSRMSSPSLDKRGSVCYEADDVCPFPLGVRVTDLDVPKLLPRSVIWGGPDPFHAEFSFQRSYPEIVDVRDWKDAVEMLGVNFKHEPVRLEELFSYVSSHYSPGVPLTKFLAYGTMFGYGSRGLAVPPNHKDFKLLLELYDTLKLEADGNLWKRIMEVDGEDVNHHLGEEELKYAIFIVKKIRSGLKKTVYHADYDQGIK